MKNRMPDISPRGRADRGGSSGAHTAAHRCSASRVCILQLAVEDAQRPARADHARAVAFLVEGGETFPFRCAVAGLSPEHVRRGVCRRLAQRARRQIPRLSPLNHAYQDAHCMNANRNRSVKKTNVAMIRARDRRPRARRQAYVENAMRTIARPIVAQPHAVIKGGT
jgi:hypothetical protein